MFYTSALMLVNVWKPNNMHVEQKHVSVYTLRELTGATTARVLEITTSPPWIICNEDDVWCLQRVPLGLVGSGGVGGEKKRLSTSRDGEVHIEM